MSVSLTNGLADLSKELGESTSSSSQARIGHYNDAVQTFVDERKWRFLRKTDTSLTTDPTTSVYDTSAITDKRTPGWISEIFIGDAQTSLSEADYYWDEVQDELVFSAAFENNTDTITIYYYYIPARIAATTSSETFPIPDRYRKVIALLAASYLQRSRYLDAQANTLFNLYSREVEKLTTKQTERPDRQPKKFPLYFRRIGFKRTYPRQGA